MIQMKNVMMKYDNGVVAMKDLNLTVDPGEFVYVIGLVVLVSQRLLKCFTMN